MNEQRLTDQAIDTLYDRLYHKNYHRDFTALPVQQPYNWSLSAVLSRVGLEAHRRLKERHDGN